MIYITGWHIDDRSLLLMETRVSQQTTFTTLVPTLWPISTSSKIGLQQLCGSHLVTKTITQLVPSGGAAWPIRNNMASDNLIEFAKIGNLQQMALLVKAGQDVNQQEPKELTTPLYWAACCGQEAACDWLIRQGADINQQVCYVIYIIFLFIPKFLFTLILLIDNIVK